MRRPGRGEGGLDLGAVGDVGGEARPAPSRSGRRPIRLTGAPSRLERGGDRRADPGAAAGDDRMLPGEPHALSSASRCRLRASWAMPPR